MATAIRFEDFSLDPADRQLRRGGEPVELSSRYFDALALLVAERGRLVTKDRFMGEVWRGIPVTDEALTQCIKTLRRQLGDDAARPRFIETVPKHGYRFIAELDGAEAVVATVPDSALRRDWLMLVGAGVTGSAIAGAFFNHIYCQPVFCDRPRLMSTSDCGMGHNLYFGLLLLRVWFRVLMR